MNFQGGSTFPRVFLGGGFKYFIRSPLFGEDFQVDLNFSDGLKPPARRAYFWTRSPMRGLVTRSGLLFLHCQAEVEQKRFLALRFFWKFLGMLYPRVKQEKT